MYRINMCYIYIYQSIFDGWYLKTNVLKEKAQKTQNANFPLKIHTVSFNFALRDKVPLW